MNIGPLDRRIEFQAKVIVADSVYGSDVVQWLTMFTIWGNVQDNLPSRAESVNAGAIEVATNPTRIRVRWRSDIHSGMRIKVNHPTIRTLQIVSGPAEIGGRRAYLEMMCEEISTDG